MELKAERAGLSAIGPLSERNVVDAPPWTRRLQNAGRDSIVGPLDEMARLVPGFRNYSRRRPRLLNSPRLSPSSGH